MRKILITMLLASAVATPALAREMVELGPPDALVGADSVEEYDRRALAAARFGNSKSVTVRADHPPHGCILAGAPPAR